MKTSGTGRVLAALFIGVIVGTYSRFRETQTLALGRQSALDAAGRRFDMIAGHHTAPVLASIILAVVAFAVYELIAAGFSRFAPPVEVDE